MTRMTKNETALLAQAAVIVDSLLPWGKKEKFPEIDFEKKPVPKALEPEKTYLEAANESVKPVEFGVPEIKTQKNMDVWYNELAAFNLGKWEGLYKDSNWVYNGPIDSLKKVSDKIYEAASLPKLAKFYSDYFSNSFIDFYKSNFTSAPKFQKHFDPTAPHVKDACRKIFLAAYNLIQNKSAWCQGDYKRKIETGFHRVYKHQPISVALPKSGEPIHEVALDYEDVPQYSQQFCSAGAIMESDKSLGYGGEGRFQLSEFAQYVGHQLGKAMGGNVARFNDSNDHYAVIKAWKECGRENGWL